MNKVIKATEANTEEAAFDVEVSESDIKMVEDTTDVYTHKFKVPVQYDGKTYESLTFDFSSLTGGDSLDVENELQSMGHAVVVRTLDGMYLSRMCAKACTENIGSDIFRVMPVKDYAIITNKSKRFF